MKRILFIHDNTTFREQVSISLEEMGYKVSRASNGGEGILAIHLFTPDLVLLELAPADTKGMSFLEELRSSANGSDIPVFVITDISDRDQVLRVVENRVSAYLLKSKLDSESLLNRIQAILGPARPDSSRQTENRTTASRNLATREAALLQMHSR